MHIYRHLNIEDRRVIFHMTATRKTVSEGGVSFEVRNHGKRTPSGVWIQNIGGNAKSLRRSMKECTLRVA
jgi:hypothetical protein